MSSRRSSSSDPIADGHRQYIESVTAGDVDGVVSLFCDDGILMPPNETSLYGAGEVREWHEEYFQLFNIQHLSETEREVTVAHGFAVERWAYAVSIDPVKGGERIRDQGRWLKIWRAEPDGSWRIAQAMFNSMRPVGSGTSRFLASIRRSSAM